VANTDPQQSDSSALQAHLSFKLLQHNLLPQCRHFAVDNAQAGYSHIEHRWGAGPMALMLWLD
jgi:hypothetical protein